MSRQRRNFTAQEKVKILREHLENNKNISEVCEEYDIHPNMFRRWKKEFFEGAIEVFKQKPKKQDAAEKKRIEKLEQTLRKRDTLIAELVSENVDLKKNLDGEI